MHGRRSRREGDNLPGPEYSSRGGARCARSALEQGRWRCAGVVSGRWAAVATWVAGGSFNGSPLSSKSRRSLHNSAQAPLHSDISKAKIPCKARSQPTTKGRASRIAETGHLPQARSVCAQCKKRRQRATLCAACVSPHCGASRPAAPAGPLTERAERDTTPHSLPPPHTTPAPQSVCNKGRVVGAGPRSGLRL